VPIGVRTPGWNAALCRIDVVAVVVVVAVAVVVVVATTISISRGVDLDLMDFNFDFQLDFEAVSPSRSAEFDDVADAAWLCSHDPRT